MLVNSIFFLFQQCFLLFPKSGLVFQPYLFCHLQMLSMQTMSKTLPFGKEFTQQNSINPFLNKPWFLRVCSTRLLKTLREEEKLLVTSNFSSSHSVFYLFAELSAIFNKYEILVCKLFQFGRV